MTGITKGITFTLMIQTNKFKYSPGMQVWYRGDWYTILHRRVGRNNEPTYWLVETDCPVHQDLLK